MKTSQLIISFSLAAILSLSASNTPAATPQDILVVAAGLEDVLTLDPAEAFEHSSGEIINNAYTRIVRRAPGDATKIIADAAVSWTQSSDGKSFTFNIRPQQLFPSGRPVTAADAAYSLRRVIYLNKTPAFLFDVFGWKKENVERLVRADGPTKLILQTTKPVPLDVALNVLATSVGSVMDSKLLEEHKRNDDYGNEWVRTSWAGSGPFRIIAWKPKDSIVLQPNQNYYGYVGRKSALKALIFQNVAESATQALLISKGDIDVAKGLQPDQVHALVPASNFSVVRTPTLTQMYIPLNQKNKVLANPKVREAFHWLIDYHNIADKLLRGQWTIHQNIYGTGVPGADENNPYKLDVQKAKRLLAEAGYEKGLTLELGVETTAPYPDIAQSLQSTFKQAGVNLNIALSDRRQIVTKYRARQGDMYLWHASSDYAEPNVYAADYALNPDNSDASSFKNRAWRSSWQDAEANALTDQASQEQDAKKRADIYARLQHKILTDSPYLFLFQQTETVVLRANIVGYQSNAVDSATYTYVSKK